MLFQKRVDRAMRYSKERAAGLNQDVSSEKKYGSVEKTPSESAVPSGVEYDPKAWQDELSLADSLEKGDLPALLISALLVLLPVCLIAVGLICLLGILPMLF